MAFFNFKRSQTIAPLSLDCLKQRASLLEKLSTYSTLHSNLLLHKGLPLIGTLITPWPNSRSKLNLGCHFGHWTKLGCQSGHQLGSQGTYFPSSCHIWPNGRFLKNLVLIVMSRLGHQTGKDVNPVMVDAFTLSKWMHAEASDACSFIEAQLLMCVWALEKSGLTNPKGKSNGFQKRSLPRRFSVNMAWMPSQIWRSFALKLLLLGGPNKCNTF